MNIDKTTISFTAPTSLAVTNAKPAVPAPIKIDTADTNNETGYNPADAVNINASEKKKLDALARKLSGGDTSLVIEKDPQGVGFIYKSINRVTGEVIKVWPREEIVSQLSAMNDVDARGLMIDASA